MKKTKKSTAPATKTTPEQNIAQQIRSIMFNLDINTFRVISEVESVLNKGLVPPDGSQSVSAEGVMSALGPVDLDIIKLKIREYKEFLE